MFALLPGLLPMAALVYVPERAVEEAPQDLSLAMLVPLPPPRLVGAYGGGGGGSIAHAPRGLFLGADTGLATMLPGRVDGAHGAWAFGARAGYQWRSGLAAQVRFDDLGVGAPDGSAPLLFATAGVRYSLPLVVMPFVEVLVGPAVYGAHVSPGAALGGGVSLPVLRHLAFDLSIRDWIAGIDGDVRHVVTAELGVSVGFGGR